MQLFLDAKTLSVLRVTPFSDCDPVDAMVLPRWGQPDALVGRVASKFLRHDSNHIVRRQRPPDPLQLELARVLDLHKIFNRHQHS